VTELDPSAVIDKLASDQNLRVFVRDRKIETLPAKLSKRLPLLDVVAQAFEPGARYPEHVVDDFLRQVHDDHAALRRYLVDQGFMDRAGGEYWRIGGTTAD
jgi:hypothetical protein